MQSISTTFILLLCLSFTYATRCNQPATDLSEKGSTIRDNLKDAFDTVYKYEKRSIFSHQKLKDVEITTLDVLLRHPPQKYPKMIVAHVENVQNEQWRSPNESSIKDAIIQKEDLQLEHFHANETESKISLDEESGILDMLLHNMTDQVKYYAGWCDGRFVNPDYGIRYTLFGECLMDFFLENTKNKTILGMSTKRNRCPGPLKDLQKYGVTDLYGRSNYTVGFVFDRTTKQFLKSFVKVEGQLVREVETTYSMLKEIYFDGFKAIQENIKDTGVRFTMYPLALGSFTKFFRE